MKKLFNFRLLVLIGVLITSINTAWAASSWTSDGTAYLYYTNGYDSNISNNWVCCSGNVYAYFWGDPGGDKWSSAGVLVSGTKETVGAVYAINIPAGTWTGYKIIRGTAATFDSGSGFWGNTGDLTPDDSKNEIHSIWQNGSGTLGTTILTSTGSIAASSTSVSPSTAVTLTPSITSNTTYNEYKSVVYSVSPNSGYTLVGNTFTPTTIGTYTITATITYNAKGFPSITNTVSPTVTVSCVSTPSIAWAASDPISSYELVTGQDITLNVTRTNSSNNIIFYKKVGDGSWEQIADQASTTYTYTLPANTGATQTYYFKAALKDGSPYPETSASDAVTVYGKKTLHVKNREGWASMYLYGGDGNTGIWPGTTSTGSNGFSIAREGSSQWYTVVITSANSEFLLNNGGSGAGNQTGNLSYGNYSDGGYYECYNHSGSTVDGRADGQLYNSTAPTAPTSVATSDEAPTSINDSQMTIHGSIGTNGNDNITSYGFYYGTTNACASQAEIAASNYTGDISKQLTSLTAGTTYYYKAYATNGQGTSYGDVQSYKVPYKVTVNTNTGCTSISPSGTQYTNSTISVTATKTTGYTFSSWSTTNGTQTSTSSTSTTNTLVFTPSANNATIQPVYTENMTTVNLVASPTGKGTFTSSEEAVTSVSAGVDTHPTVTAVPGTGYHLAGTIWSESSDYISLSATNTAATTITATGETGKTVDLTATFTPNTYSIHFNDNGSTSGEMSDQTDIAYDSETTITANAFVKTGYNFAGWATTAEKAAAGTVDRNDGAAHGNLSSTQGATVNLYAVWTPKQSALSFDYQSSAEGHGTDGSISAVSATYDAAMPALSGSMPTAAEGYAFMGFYDATGGGGTKYYNADGTSAATWDKDKTTGTTLYAYYKKAEITELTLAATTVGTAETDSITVTPTIEPTPEGTVEVCYEIQYSNGTPLPSQPLGRYVSGNVYRFKAPTASATYRIEAKLCLDDGAAGCSGTLLHTATTTFQVAGEHTVTIRYQDSDGRTLQASSSIEARPLTWTTLGDITPPTITGYTFARWDAGDGVSIKNGESAPVTTTTTSSIQIKASYDGTLTAVYNKKNMIFFNNTLGWDTVFVYFYNSNKYWNDTYGTGAHQGQYFDNCCKPYWETEHSGMKRVAPGSNIWYFDYTDADYSTRPNVVFANMDKSTTGDTSPTDNNDLSFFANTTSDPIQVVRRGDHKTSLPMFVPLSGQTGVKRNSSKAVYYSEGYWMNYPENTGYVLHVYNGTEYGASDQMQEIPFEFNEDKTLPMSIKVELNAGRTYGFEIHRADGTVLAENSYTLKSGDSGDEEQTVRTIGETTTERSKITTAVAGDYTFKLNFGNSGGYNYLIGVHYPVAIGDYRVLYTDDATWSKGAHDGTYATWWHESRTIHKENGATDIVSFYVKDDEDTKVKFQYVSSINASTGAVSWADVDKDGDGNADVINISSMTEITKDGVYNFHLTQANDDISISMIEPYTGKYYIRTDCAGATKWENFRTADHEMTYSDYTETNHGYSHYYPHWVDAGGNVKFCIANDYSPCISDTLVEDYGTVIADINSGGYLQNYGANIRFMWNQSTNKIWRAYIGGSSNITDRFLVLESNTKMFDASGNALTGVNQDHRMQGGVNTYLGTDNQVILYDDQNFVYERTVKVNATDSARLSAKYNGNVQYFIGTSGDWGPSTTVELLGGTYNAEKKYTMRIVYDFKTNRLVTAYVPDGDITEALAIHADIMLVREHQEAGQQLTFKGEGSKLTDVKTVYGVMRFNRWTLNNKETTGGHSVVGDPKSAYERGLYWISFPFDVNLSDVFGFGTYGVDWIIMYYDGAKRATDGYWADSEGFWTYITNRNGKVLEAGKGYVLALDLDRMHDDNTSFWSNNIEQVELFFPSAADIVKIQSTNVQTTVDSHPCSIDRTGNDGSNINKNRTKADSHWNVIGIPSYANYGAVLKDGEGGSNITWNSSPYTNDLPFLYEWNSVDNSYSVQSGTTYPFKAMHAYMVQYTGNIYWSLASATPSPVAARQTDVPDVEYMLSLIKDSVEEDHTYVRMSDKEGVTAGFEFGQDLCKEYNGNKGNIYTFVGYLPVAGNSQPHPLTTTIVPVGVKIAANGEYTFSMPEGTNGGDVWLIDNANSSRTNLGLMDYTVNLTTGTYEGRFSLEFPVQNVVTEIENAANANANANADVRKVFVGGRLYILRDGKAYDATGAQVR